MYVYNQCAASSRNRISVSAAVSNSFTAESSGEFKNACAFLSGSGSAAAGIPVTGGSGVGGSPPLYCEMVGKYYCNSVCFACGGGRQSKDESPTMKLSSETPSCN